MRLSQTNGKNIVKHVGVIQIIYRNNIDLIDPDKKRGRGYDLDHIIPLSYGFLNNIGVEHICHPLNLQLLPSTENKSKGTSIVDKSIISNIINKIKKHEQKTRNTK